VPEEPSIAKDRLLWQQQRRRPDGHFDLPVRYFGPPSVPDDIGYTLWLPSPKVEVKYVFKDGRPVRTVVESCMTRPEVISLRNEIVATMTHESALKFAVFESQFLEYAATVIGINYILTDEDLTMLLGGTRWHEAIIQHVIGGQDFIATVAAAAPHMVFPDAARHDVAPAISPPRTLLSRAIDFVLRRKG
jgi:hypothetical protein